MLVSLSEGRLIEHANHVDYIVMHIVKLLVSEE